MEKDQEYNESVNPFNDRPCYTQLSTTNAKAAWGLMQLHRKIHSTSSDDFQK
jgi:hypothetical protein